MTDDRPTRRLDLGALDAGPDDSRTDALIAAVTSHIAAGARTPRDDVVWLLRARRRMLAAAAVLALIATGAVLGASPRTASPGMEAGAAADLIAHWAQSAHAPTNGELLATFQGYSP